MEQEKKTYYIDLNSGEILENQIGSSPGFKIQADYEELTELKQCFNERHSRDLETFARAHVPFLEYHHDPENTRYDESLKRIYSMIYKLGDSEAKRHIEKIGILNKNRSSQSIETENFK